MNIIKEKKMAVNDWQCALDGVKKRIIYLFNTLEGCDCVFEVGGEKEMFKAHRFILSMTSPVFNKMFDGKFHESGAILLPDTEPKSFTFLLRYIYTDDIAINSLDDACNLYYLAEKYMLPFLCEHCVKYIRGNIKIADVCQAYEFAKLFNLSDLLKFSEKKIFKETEQVISDKNFISIQKETLLMILEQDSLNIKSEIVLYDAVMKWAEAEISRKEINDKKQIYCLYEELLTKIRFMTMKPKEFADGPAICGYISNKNICDIFINISSSEAKKNYPDKYKVSNWNKCRCHITQEKYNYLQDPYSYCQSQYKSSSIDPHRRIFHNPNSIRENLEGAITDEEEYESEEEYDDF